MLIIQELKTMRNFNQLKIAVAGIGYVGLSIAEDTFQARLLGFVPFLTYKVYPASCPDMDYIAPMEGEELDKTISKYIDMSTKEFSQLL